MSRGLAAARWSPWRGLRLALWIRLGQKCRLRTPLLLMSAHPANSVRGNDRHGEHAPSRGQVERKLLRLELEALVDIHSTLQLGVERGLGQ